MFDLEQLREDPARVKEICKAKNKAVDVDAALKVAEARAQLLREVEQLRHERNQLTQAAKGSKPSDTQIKAGKQLKEKLSKLEGKLDDQTQKLEEYLRSIPNDFAGDTPVGPDESANTVLRTAGGPPRFDFPVKQHWELGATLGLIDSERGAKVAGSRFHILRGGLVLLQMALLHFAIEKLTDPEVIASIVRDHDLKVSDKPFVPLLMPAMLSADALTRSGRLEPRDDKYFLEKDNLFLSGSAEHTMIAMHSDEILTAEELPLRYLGYSTAFRREAGSYGRDTRGIIRVHQFDKLEMESFVRPEDSDQEHAFQVAVQEYLMQQLGMHYQVVAISTGDMGAPDFRQTDIETWMPGQGAFRETHSADQTTDYQARALNIRYRRDEQRTELLHLCDATAFAMSRLLAAIMEHYQQADGTIKVPEVLQGYFDKEVV